MRDTTGKIGVQRCYEMEELGDSRCDPNAKLSDCLHQLDEKKSLSQLVDDTR